MPEILYTVAGERYRVSRIHHLMLPQPLIHSIRTARYLALKIASNKERPPCRCPPETSLLPIESDEDLHPGQGGLPYVLDIFTLADGENEVDCAVYPLYAQSIMSLTHQGGASLPWNTLRRIALQVLLVLEYLHNIRGVIHTGRT